LLHGRVPPSFAPGGGQRPIRAPGNARLFQRVPEALLALAHGLKAWGPRHMRNPSPPEARQMLASQPGTAQVIWQQANGIWIGDLGKRIKQRHGAPPKLERWSPIRPAPGDDDAVDPLRQQGTHVLALARKVVGSGAQEDGYLRSLERIFDALEKGNAKPAVAVG